MPKTVSTEVFTLAELPKGNARNQALSWLAEVNTDHGWWESTYQDAARVGVKITSFDLDRANNIGATSTMPTAEIAKAILAEHGPLCETFQLAKKYQDNITALGAEPSGKVWGQWAEKENEIALEFWHGVTQAYLSMLRAEFEYLQSEEALIDFSEANEYTFTVDGTRFG